MKRALITGITGQDGSYLMELLFDKGYEVHGLVRRVSTSNLQRIAPLCNEEARVLLHEGDLGDASSLRRIVQEVAPDEVYNLAAQSHVGTSFGLPEYTAQVDGMGVLSLLEALRDIRPTARFYQASTSELFGKVQRVPQCETTPFYPRSPYAIAKLFAYWTVVNYREAYQMYACNGILFNHESPRRGESFVTRKITLGAARIRLGLQEKLFLGNLDAKRDWGHARDFVEGMWRMLQQDAPEDYVLATGTSHTVKEFVQLAFQEVGIELVWEGEGVAQKGREVGSGRVLVEVSEKWFRPSEVDMLLGDASKARARLGWRPTTSLQELVREMVQVDLKMVASERELLIST